MSDFNYQVGNMLFGYPIVAVDNPYVSINLPTNIQITADLTQGPGNLASLLSTGAGYIPPQVPSQIG